MANNSVTALGAIPGNGSGNALSANATAANLGQNEAANSIAAAQPDPIAGSWVADFCRDYGEAMLFAGQVFLYVGLLLAVAVAAIEIYVAFKSAKDSPGQQDKMAQGLTPLPSIIEALKSLLTALSSAKIWLALTIVGLLLLWMAATAPRLCVTGSDGGDPKADNPPAKSSRVVPSNAVNSNSTTNSTNSVSH
jgi:hypothetical protein